MIGPLFGEHKNVAEFEDAFTNCRCPTDDVVLTWLPAEGMPLLDSGSEDYQTFPKGQDTRQWLATCPLCKVQFQLRWVLQRPSDHTTPYGYVQIVDDEAE